MSSYVLLQCPEHGELHRRAEAVTVVVDGFRSEAWTECVGHMLCRPVSERLVSVLDDAQVRVVVYADPD